MAIIIIEKWKKDSKPMESLADVNIKNINNMVYGLYIRW